jgi:hypothetical protein
MPERRFVPSDHLPSSVNSACGQLDSIGTLLNSMNDRASLIIQKRLLLGTMICIVLLIVGYFFFVNTSEGHRLDDDAFLGRAALKRRVIILDSNILELVSKAAILLAAGALLLIAAVRRCTLVGFIAVLGFGCAVVGAEVLKRSLPWRMLVPNDALIDSGLQTGTYPSGHATIGTSLAMSLILVSSARWRPWFAVVAACLSATFATGVLFAGWHRPSDALGALAWSGLCMTLAAALAVRLRGRPTLAIAHTSRAFFCSAGVAMLVTSATWLIAAKAAPLYPHEDLPFSVLTGLIIAGAFTLIAWYGWQLQAVDWPAGQA